MTHFSDTLNRIRWREGDRVIVVAGEHTGRFGRVMLTHDSTHHRLVAQMLALSADRCRVMLDRAGDLGSWSGVLAVAALRATRPETDEEFLARMGDHPGPRREVPIFGADYPNGGFHPR